MKNQKNNNLGFNRGFLLLGLCFLSEAVIRLTKVSLRKGKYSLPLPSLRRMFESSLLERKRKNHHALVVIFSFGTPETIRTSDARFRKPTLYPLSYGSISHYIYYSEIIFVSTPNRFKN